MISSTIMDELSSTTVRLSNDVFAQELDDEAVLLDMRSGEYFGINATGCHIWQEMSEGIELTGIAASISRSFRLEREVAAADVMSFVRRLGEMGLVEIDEDSE